MDLDSGPYTGAGLYQVDFDLGHVLRPHAVTGDIRINSHGFRDPERPVARTPGAYRILGIGDSFAFGSRDPDGIYLRVLEARLLAEGRRVEVINTGVPGYNTLQEITHLRRFGLQFQPDLVLLGLFVTGDVIENHGDVRLQVVAGELTSRPVDRLGRLLMASRIWRLLVVRGVVHADDRGNVHRWFLDVERDRLRPCGRRPRPDIRHGYEVTERALVELRDLLRARGIDLVVLLIPDEVQVNPVVFEDTVATFGLARGDFDLDQPNRLLGEALARAGIASVDPLPDLREAQRTGPVYWPDDTHLNVQGAAVVASRLASAVGPRIRRP